MHARNIRKLEADVQRRRNIIVVSLNGIELKITSVLYGINVVLFNSLNNFRSIGVMIMFPNKIYDSL